MDHDRLVATYAAVLAAIDGLTYSAYDIEALADSLGHGEEIPLLVPGPAGLYLSALINRTAAPDVHLHLEGHRHRLHFLGYRLGPGRTLTLTGAAGDFTGAGLDGGRLVVEGPTGAWCGAGMLGGSIRVSGDAGPQTGQWMHAGDIHVAGRVSGVGGLRYGGRVFQGRTEVGGTLPAGPVGVPGAMGAP